MQTCTEVYIPHSCVPSTYKSNSLVRLKILSYLNSTKLNKEVLLETLFTISLPEFIYALHFLANYLPFTKEQIIIDRIIPLIKEISYLFYTYPYVNQIVISAQKIVSFCVENHKIDFSLMNSFVKDFFIPFNFDLLYQEDSYDWNLIVNSFIFSSRFLQNNEIEDIIISQILRMEKIGIIRSKLIFLKIVLETSSKVSDSVQKILEEILHDFPLQSEKVQKYLVTSSKQLFALKRISNGEVTKTFLRQLIHDKKLNRLGVKNLLHFAKGGTLEHKKLVADLTRDLLKENSPTINKSIAKIWARLIMQLGPSETPLELISLKEIYNKLSEKELEYIAKGFSGVLKTLGGFNRWEELSTLFQFLCQSSYIEIRRIMAFNLHKTAEIMGDNKLIEDNLIHINIDFLKDNEKVKIATLQNLPLFVRHVSPIKRTSYVEGLQNLLISPKSSWRVRFALSEILVPFSKLLDSDSVRQSIIPLNFTLIDDKYRMVNSKASENLACFLYILSKSKEEASLRIVCNKILVLKRETSFGRQRFVSVCEEVLKNDEELFLRFKDDLFGLKDDPVINVRISLAIFVKKNLLRLRVLCKEEVKELIQDLRKDDCFDVNFNLV